ncbi:tRNA (pseudouridine(54)-N(1))-methyltransferase TrmY [Methanofervidicoccus abyssi]|uniref:tRNA (pseudouridine(54)-N(1))-methyltransferase n=1 Tax=Methanofervidicoccus abyssi TaxID=2082189 RepID=A0A401HPZ9_9EURY|nr:tRNA (pseudouridine(54)-N(1))-methyltransferase TrmY [Methanofervidicoccus abyssi]GBF36344.1 tRNA (pseudouridine54-N1)-methyltransferase [Methanofervidicoccus abyssi]
MREFILKANKAITSGNVNLKDLPGSCGRLDLVCRCISSAFFLSHDIRRDTVFYSVHYGEPNPPVALKFVGSELKRLSPDERSIAIFIKKALSKEHNSKWRESTPGIYHAKKDFREIVLEKIEKGRNVYFLHLRGKPIKDVINSRTYNEIKDRGFVFILGDHIGLTEEDERFLNDLKIEKLSLSPLELHANQCIDIVHNILDKLEYRR